MLEIKNMRLPTCEEWDKLVEVVDGEDSIMHWKSIFSWCHDTDPDCPARRAFRGYYSARGWDYRSASTRYVPVGFRPAFEPLGVDALGPDGSIAIVGTLYMNGQPVRIPQEPTQYGDILDYFLGAKLELREALEDPDYQIRAIKVGGILVADRVLLKNISWTDLQENLLQTVQAEPKELPKPEIEAIRLPSSTEWDRLIDATLGVNSLVHWKGTASWCSDAATEPSFHIARGMTAGRNISEYKDELRMVGVGFRPAFQACGLNSIKDGDTVTIGTLYMDGKPVPTNHDGDRHVPAYVPGAALEFKEPADESEYQITAIKVGNILIADRVLLREISWMDLDDLGFCSVVYGEPAASKPAMDNKAAIIAFEDEEFGNFLIACSRENTTKVRCFIEKRYPDWVKKSREQPGICPMHYILEAVDDMKDLLVDESLQCISSCDIVRL